MKKQSLIATLSAGKLNILATAFQKLHKKDLGTIFFISIY